MIAIGRNTQILMPGGMGAGLVINTAGGNAQNPYGGPGSQSYHQCTWGVWQYVYDNFGVAMPDMPGNATDWVADAQQKGWKVLQVATAHTAVVWSNTKYPPFGHVAFVTAVHSGAVSGVGPKGGAVVEQKPEAFDVYEYNFPSASNDNAGLSPGTRTIQLNSADADGIEGFIQIPGVTPGDQLSGVPGNQPVVSDPWSEFTAGLASAEASAEQQLEDWGKKALAAGEAALGLGIIAGGVYLIGKDQGVKVPSNAGQTQPRITKKQIQRATSTSPEPATPSAPPPAPKPDKNAAGAIRKAQAGQFARMTPSEVKWLQEHPLELREGLRGGPAPRAVGVD